MSSGESSGEINHRGVLEEDRRAEIESIAIAAQRFDHFEHHERIKALLVERSIDIEFFDWELQD